MSTRVTKGTHTYTHTHKKSTHIHTHTKVATPVCMTVRVTCRDCAEPNSGNNFAVFSSSVFVEGLCHRTFVFLFLQRGWKRRNTLSSNPGGFVSPLRLHCSTLSPSRRLCWLHAWCSHVNVGSDVIKLLRRAVTVRGFTWNLFHRWNIELLETWFVRCRPWNWRRTRWTERCERWRSWQHESRKSTLPLRPRLCCERSRTINQKQRLWPKIQARHRRIDESQTLHQTCNDSCITLFQRVMFCDEWSTE